MSHAALSVCTIGNIAQNMWFPEGEQAKDQQKLLSNCLDDLPELTIASGHLLGDDASLQGPIQVSIISCGEGHPVLI